MSSDNQEILSLQNGSFLDERMYKSKQLLYITPLGTPAIAVNQDKINFSFKEEGPYFVSFKDAWIEVPITITKGAESFSLNPLLAAKQSLLSLIKSVSITTTGGVTILDTENDLHFTSNLRLLLENNPDYLESIASQIHFSKDKPLSKFSNVMRTEATLTGARSDEFEEKKIAALGDAATPSRNKEYNDGFMQRNSHLLADALYNTAVVITKAEIPLKLIHDFFERLDFPIHQPNIRIELGFNVGSSAYKPFAYARKNATAGTDADYEAKAVEYTTTLTVGEEPRLYYHRVEFEPDVAAEVASMFEKSFQRSIKYRRYILSNEYPTTAGIALEKDIASDATNVSRVFGLLGPSAANSINGVKFPSPLLTTGALDDANVWVHRMQQFQRNIQGDSERWNLLKAEFPYEGTDNGPINYNEFKSRYNILVMNCKRLGYYPNKGQSTVVKARCVPTATGIARFVVEEERSLLVKFDTKGLVRVYDTPDLKDK